MFTKGYDDLHHVLMKKEMQFCPQAALYRVYSGDSRMTLSQAGSGAKSPMKKPIQYSFCFCAVKHRKFRLVFRATREVEGEGILSSLPSEGGEKPGPPRVCV